MKEPALGGKRCSQTRLAFLIAKLLEIVLIHLNVVV
jgi:hypothetical protein